MASAILETNEEVGELIHVARLSEEEGEESAKFSELVEVLRQHLNYAERTGKKLTIKIYLK